MKTNNDNYVKTENDNVAKKEHPQPNDLKVFYIFQNLF